MVIDPALFRAYDIRGIVKTSLTPEVVFLIGKALGTKVREAGRDAIVVGRDGRLSGPELENKLIRGILTTGTNVISAGCVPTPLTYYAASKLGIGSCASITGSHNPPEYNGIKVMIDGATLSGDQIQDLRACILGQNFSSGQGICTNQDIKSLYIKEVTENIQLKRTFKVLVDCGNGVAGMIAPELLQALGCEVVELYCDVDGHFPNHHPDPSKPENLQDMIQKMKGSDIDFGLAFDGDGDRLGIVTEGEIIYPDRQLLLFIKSLLLEKPGATIIYDVKCSRLVKKEIELGGGQALMWKTGHSHIKNKLKETKASLAGEMSGHFFFNDRWYGFDDALYSAARLLEILSLDTRMPSEVLGSLPKSAESTPEINVKMEEGQPHQLITALQKRDDFFQAAMEVSHLDGIRAEYSDGFGLARPSNTTPVIVLRFEADSEEALTRIKNEFSQAIEAVWPGLHLDF